MNAGPGYHPGQSAEEACLKKIALVLKHGLSHARAAQILFPRHRKRTGGSGLLPWLAESEASEGKAGHGSGLHSSAQAARQTGGNLTSPLMATAPARVQASC